MRIVGGKFRGKTLKAPKSEEIRPTADRVRENIFNILSSRIGPNFAGHVVLDLFAGTGALGLEALSRGADYAVFVETGIEGRGIIRDHIEGFGVAGSARLLKRDATKLGGAERFRPATLVFLDPPYGQELGEKALAAAAHGGWIAPGALLMFEERADAAGELPEGFELLDARRYGDTRIALLRYAGSTDLSGASHNSNPNRVR